MSQLLPHEFIRTRPAFQPRSLAVTFEKLRANVIEDIGAALRVPGDVLRHAGSAGRLQSAGPVVGELSLDLYGCRLTFRAEVSNQMAFLHYTHKMPCESLRVLKRSAIQGGVPFPVKALAGAFVRIADTGKQHEGRDQDGDDLQNSRGVSHRSMVARARSVVH